MNKLIIIIFLILVFIFSFQFFSAKMTPSPYFAIFLANGQVYFGHITQLTTDTMRLEDVYYLRTQSNLSTQTLNDKKEDSDVQLAIVKLGKEIHAPKGTMMINKQQILFWEPLRDDGEVVKAIEKYK